MSSKIADVESQSCDDDKNKVVDIYRETPIRLLGLKILQNTLLARASS